MKKIVYLLHQFPRSTDTFIRREIRSLEQQGTAVHVVSVWKPRSTPPSLINEWSGSVTTLLPRPILSILAAILSAALSPRRFFATTVLALKTSQPGLRGLTYQGIYLVQAILAADALSRLKVNHVHNHFGDHSGIVTMLAAKLCGIEYSISFHGPHVFLDGKTATIKEKVRRAKFVRCIGYFCRSQVLLFSEGEGYDKMSVARCGLDIEEFHYRLPRREVSTIFCAARLAPEKGIEFLIMAMACSAINRHAVELRIAGDGPCRSHLEQIAVKLGIGEKVSFLGNLSSAAITNELTSADLFVLPSLAEGIPVSLMEAMATGVPVVTTNVAGTSELVEHGKSGLLVRPTDPHALAEAVALLIEDYDLRQQLSIAARSKIIEEFNLQKETAKLSAFFG